MTTRIVNPDDSGFRFVPLEDMEPASIGDVKKRIAEALAPLVKRITTLEARVAKLEGQQT